MLLGIDFRSTFKQVECDTISSSRSSLFLFVVQPNEHRVFDQRWFQYEFLEKYIRHLVHDHQTNLAE
jgi:hypothetical protein